MVHSGAPHCIDLVSMSTNTIIPSSEADSVPRPSERPGGALTALLGRTRDNLAFGSVWSELNGAMGDLGTYIPIVLALALAKDLDLGTTLVFTGVYNVVTGAIYGVPMPVQPMKSIAAVAISSSGFGVPEIMAAGICTSGVVFLLGATRLMALVYRFIPLPVVRGIQLAQGLSFAMTAVKYVRYDQDLAKGKSFGQRPWLGFDGLVLAILATIFILIVNGAGEQMRELDEALPERAQPEKKGRSWRKVIFSVPSAVVVFVLGVVLAVIREPHVVKQLKAGPSGIHVVKISKRAWKDGFVKGAIPQLPLSVLNSVVTVCKLTADLFPERTASSTSVSITVGLMNLVGCWFGAMPCCHGAGGLAGQYKFGGRSGACVAALGTAKLVVGLVLGGSLLKLLVEFPVCLLGVLLLFAGVELAMAARDMSSKGEALVVLICAAVSLVGSSAALGFLCGMVAHVLIVLRKSILER